MNYFILTVNPMKINMPATMKILMGALFILYMTMMTTMKYKCIKI